MLHVVRDRIKDFLSCRWNGNSRFDNWRNVGQDRFGGSWGRRCTSKQYLAGLWNDSDSKLSQEINAQNGICHCSLQKFAVKSLP